MFLLVPAIQKEQTMNCTNRAKIAIVAKFPLSYIIERGREPKGYHCVWLLTLHKLFQQQEQYDIHWIVLDKSIKKDRSEVLHGQTFHLLPKARMTIGLCTRYVYDRWQICKTLKSINPDLVHAWGTEDCHGLAVSRFKGKKILSIQGLLIAISQRARMARFEQLQGRLYEATTVKRYARITVESEWGVDRVKELNPASDVKRWEYAIPEYFYSAERTMSSVPTCVIAGSNTPVKNVRCALEAFSKPELANVTLYMAGVAPGAFPNLPSNIIPLGFVPHEEMSKVLASAWALVHPSLADTCPNIVKEARVMGIPAVVTHDCGAKQYIVNGKSGYVISPNNVDELAEAVLAMVSNRELNIAMGEFDRERCRTAISQDTMMKSLLNIYSSILNE